MNKGKIVQVMGPVVDVEFQEQDLPNIKDALTVELNGKKSRYGGCSTYRKSYSAMYYVGI